MHYRKLQEPKRASIKFQTRDLKSRVSVFGTIGGDRKRQQKEQSQNIIVTGKAHRAIIEIPEAFEPSRMEQASTKILVTNDNIKILTLDMKEHMAVFQKIHGKDLKYSHLLMNNFFLKSSAMADVPIKVASNIIINVYRLFYRFIRNWFS